MKLDTGIREKMNSKKEIDKRLEFSSIYNKVYFTFRSKFNLAFNESDSTIPQ